MRLIFTVLVALFLTGINLLLPNSCSGQEGHLSATAISSIQPQDVKPFAVPVLTEDEAKRANDEAIMEWKKWRTKELTEQIKNIIIIIFPFVLTCILFGVFNVPPPPKKLANILPEKPEEQASFETNKQTTSNVNSNRQELLTQQTGTNQEDSLIQIEILKKYFVDLKDYFSLELTSSDGKRDCYIDFIRGLAALSVVYIHTCFWSGQSYIPEWWSNTALLFDVPVFFLLAGMLMGRSRNSLVPGAAFKLSISFTLLIIIADSIGGNLQLTNVISSIFLVKGKSNTLVGVAGSYWFVSVFMFSLIFSEVFIRFYNRYILVIIAILLAFYPLAQLEILDVQSFAGIRSQACYVAFTLLGCWMTTRKIAENKRKKFLFCTILSLISILFITISCIKTGIKPTFNLQQNKFPVNVSYIGLSLVPLIIISAFYSCRKRRLPKCICKIGTTAIWFYAGQCVGLSLLYKITPFLHASWPIKMVFAFFYNLLLTLASAIILQLIYTLLNSLLGLFRTPQMNQTKKGEA